MISFHYQVQQYSRILIISIWKFFRDNQKFVKLITNNFSPFRFTYFLISTRLIKRAIKYEKFLKLITNNFPPFCFTYFLISEQLKTYFILLNYSYWMIIIYFKYYSHRSYSICENVNHLFSCKWLLNHTGKPK